MICIAPGCEDSGDKLFNAIAPKSGAGSLVRSASSLAFLRTIHRVPYVSLHEALDLKVLTPRLKIVC